MKKNSFTLFEVLISLVILSIMILGITKLFKDNNINRQYYKLQEIESNYIEHNILLDDEIIKFSTK